MLHSCRDVQCYILADPSYYFKQSYCTVAGVSNVHNLQCIFIALNLLIIECVDVTSTYPTVYGSPHRHLSALYYTANIAGFLIMSSIYAGQTAVVGTSAVVPVSSLFNAVVSPF